jgi:hypothetical protein
MVRAIASSKFGTSIVSEKLGINCFIVFNMTIRKKEKIKGIYFRKAWVDSPKFLNP